MTNAAPPSFAYFGTPRVASDTLAELLAAGYVPSVVVTSPDRARGRGLEVTSSETATLARANNVPVLTPEHLDEVFLKELERFAPQFAIVVAYGKLLSQSVIDFFPSGVLNIHYSLLPKYRGASPVEGALLGGEKETGVTIQRMALKMDAGDILAQRTLPIGETDTVVTLRPRLISLGAELLIETLPSFIAGEATFTSQNEADATFSGKIPKEAGLLSFTDDPEHNWEKYRAYHESPGTYFYARKGTKRIRVKIVDAVFDRSVFIVKKIIPESKSEQDFEMLVRNGWVAE